jgi:thiamine biosynthesis lipoprotein
MKDKISRRHMLRIVAAAGISGLAFKLGLEKRSVTISETRLLIGTIVNLTVITTDAVTGRAAVRACLDRMSALESVLSRFIPASELSLLNRNGRVAPASRPFLDVLQQAQLISTLSDGAFDVTILPVLSLYQDSVLTGQRLPSKPAIQRAKELVDFRQLVINNDSVLLTRPGMGITLDGIAKGYIVDAAVAVLREHGFGDVLVKAGGDLMALGQTERREQWEIGIQNPRGEQGALIARFSAKNQAVATSGDYMQPFTADFSEHHILNPRTGHSAPELSSATVVAPTAMLADALATAVMVTGAKRGLELVRAMPGCEACLVTKESKLLKPRGFKELYEDQGPMPSPFPGLSIGPW